MIFLFSFITLAFFSSLGYVWHCLIISSRLDLSIFDKNAVKVTLCTSLTSYRVDKMSNCSIISNVKV